VLNLPNGAVVTVPETYCYTKSTLTPATHPGLFAASLTVPDAGWKGRPRLRRGHDVSGHIFILTMSVLFLVDQLRYSFSSPGSGRRVVSWSTVHGWAVLTTSLILALELFASYTTSLYFHTPLEKFTGFVLGLLGYGVTQLPIFQHAPEAAVKVSRIDAALNGDAAAPANGDHWKDQ